MGQVKGLRTNLPEFGSIGCLSLFMVYIFPTPRVCVYSLPAFESRTACCLRIEDTYSCGKSHRGGQKKTLRELSGGRNATKGFVVNSLPRANLGGTWARVHTFKTAFSKTSYDGRMSPHTHIGTLEPYPLEKCAPLCSSRKCYASRTSRRFPATRGRARSWQSWGSHAT